MTTRKITPAMVPECMKRLVENHDFKTFTDIWRHDIELLSQEISTGGCKSFDEYKLAVLKRQLLIDILESPIKFAERYTEREAISGGTNADPYLHIDDLRK